MKKNSVKYLQGISVWLLTVAEKNEIKNYIEQHTIELCLSHRQVEYKLRWKTINLARYAKRKWFSGCAERNALLGLLINKIIILTPTLI